MKAYLLFAGHDYYPAGGFEDFLDSFDSIIEAQFHLNAALDNDGHPFYDWGQIVCRDSQEMVWSGISKHYLYGEGPQPGEFAWLANFKKEESK